MVIAWVGNLCLGCAAISKLAPSAVNLQAVRTPFLLSLVVPALFSACMASSPPREPSTSSPAGTPAERFLRVTTPAGTLRVSEGGAGDDAPVIFVHGMGTSLDVWKGQLPFVRASGRRAIAYDQRGHGASDAPKDGIFTMDALAQDLEAVRATLGISRFVLVGHSVSGDVVSAYAGAHPERLAGIVYVDADGDFGMLSREQRQGEVDKAARYGAAEWRAEFDESLGPNAKPGTRAQVLGALAKMDTHTLAAMRADNVFFPARERSSRFKGPRWAIEVDGPGAEFRAGALDPAATHLVTMRGVGHWLMLDDPEGFNAHLADALAAMR
jgi:pimeloyl-ACP methyl ester carboxylesterase